MNNKELMRKEEAIDIRRIRQDLLVEIDRGNWLMKFLVRLCTTNKADRKSLLICKNQVHLPNPLACVNKCLNNQLSTKELSKWPNYKISLLKILSPDKTEETTLTFKTITDPTQLIARDKN